jgi:multimeric flavodoxin WrbA
MPTGYVKKLAKKHGVSTSTAEKHWGMAKAAAKKEGHGEDYGYVTSIFKNMMHENLRIPSLKDLTNGMTFKYFLVAEADAEAPTQERSPIYKHLADRFPQFNELSFKARREIEKEVQAEDLLGDYESLPQEERDSVDEYLHDLVIDKMQAEVGQGSMMGDWKGEDEYKRREQARKDLEAALDAEEGAPKAAEQPGEVAPEQKKRFSAGPRHIAAMRQQHIPTDKAAFAPAGSDEVGAPVKSYYKPWSALNPEQRTARSGLAKKHGTIYRVKNAGWFRAMPPAQQEAILSVLKSGGSVADARKAAM